MTRLTIPQDHVAHSSCFMCWPTRIQTPLFVLANYVSSHALTWYLEGHKEFFIWLHAPNPCQSYLNSWDNHDADLEPYLEFFSLQSNTQDRLEVHKEFFKWLHAPNPCQTYLNSWDNHDADLEPHLEFFSWKSNTQELDHMRFFSSNRWSWCQYTRYIFVFMAYVLESNTWTTSNNYGIFFHINSMKTLVHRDCH